MKTALITGITGQGESKAEKGYLTAIDEKLFIEKVGSQYLENIKQKIVPSSNRSLVQSPPRPLALSSSRSVVEVDPLYFRPAEVDMLIGDPAKAHEKLGWHPEYDLKGLIEDMMQSDINLMKKEAYLKEGGYRVMNYFE